MSGNARDKKQGDVDANGHRIFNPSHPTVGPDVVRLDDIATGAGLVKASATADATHGATFSPAVKGTDYQGPTAYEGADIVTGAPGNPDTFILKDTVASWAALAALGTGTGAGNLHTGSRVRVRSVHRDYVLDKASTLTADGKNVIAAAGGGNWIAQLALDQHWLAQSTWYWDPSNVSTLADDEKDGSSGAPILTYAELARRLIGAKFAKTITVWVMSNPVAGDPIFPAFDCPSSSQGTSRRLIFRGVKTLAFSGIVTNYVQRNAATNTATQMQINSLASSWTASNGIAKIVEGTNGSGTFTQAWAIQDLGSKTARLSIPYSGDYTADVAPTGTETQFTNGQTVSVYSVPTIAEMAWVNQPWNAYFVDLVLPTTIILGGNAVSFGRCRFTTTIVAQNCVVAMYSCHVAAMSLSLCGLVLTNGCVIGAAGVSCHPVRSTIQAIDSFTMLRLAFDGNADGPNTFIANGDVEHWLSNGQTDTSAQVIFNVTDNVAQITCIGEVYGDPCANIVQFGAGHGANVSFRKLPKITSSVWPFGGPAIMSGNKVVGGANAFRPFPVSDLAISSFRDELGNVVTCSEGTSPAFEAVTHSIAARVDTVAGAPHLILRQQSSGIYAYAKGDSAANASGELAVVMGSQQITGSNVWVLAGVGGRLLAQFDGTPTVGAMAYLSPTTDGNATTTLPAVAGTNQMRALGVVVAVSGTLGSIDWNPDPGPRAAFLTATVYYNGSFDIYGRFIGGGTTPPVVTAYQSISINGAAALPSQTLLNFSSSFVGANNTSPARTDIALANVGPGAGTIGGAGLAIQSQTLNAFGQVTGATTVAVESPLTISTGLTRVGNVVTNDVVTGIASTTPGWRGSFTSGGALTIYASTVSPGALRLVAGSYVLSGIGTGLLKATSDTLGLAVAGTDYVATAYYQFVDDAGSATSQQTRLNVLRPLVATPDALAFRTNLSLGTTGPGAGVIGGAGLAIQSITPDAYGRVTAASTVAIPDSAASFWTSKAESSLSAEVNIGALTTGLLKISVAGGVATPSTATPNPGPGASGDYEPPLNFSTGFTRSGNTITNDVVTGVASTTPAWRGSFTAGGTLWIYASTVSPGQLRLVAGNYALSGIGTGLLKATSDVVGLATVGVDFAAPITAANGSVLYMAGGAVTGDPSSFFYDSSQFGLLAYSYDFTQRALAYVGVPPRGINIKAGAHTNLPTAELVDFHVNLARTVTFVAGNIPTMRPALFDPPTYAFASGSTIATAATLAVSGAPAAGANATITNPLAFWVQAGAAQFDGGVRTFGITGTGALAAFSLSQAANNVSTGGTAKGIGTSFTFAPTSGTAGFNALDVSYAVNQTGGANGTVRGIFVNATPTSVLGTHRLLELQLNGSPKFYIDAATGNIATTIASSMVKSVGGTLAPAIPNTDYEPFLAFNTGLTRTINTVTNDVFAGANLATVFWRGSTQVDGNLFIQSNTTGDSGSLTVEGGGKILSSGITLQHDNQFNGTSGVQRAVKLQSTFAPTSGTGQFRALGLEYTVNQTGGANGAVYGFAALPTLTAVNGLHYPFIYAPGGTVLWRVEGSGKMWMAPVATAFQGDIGMTSLGRPRFHHNSGGTQPVAATNDPLYVLKFSGIFQFGISGGAYQEQSFADPGIQSYQASAAFASAVALSGPSDTWASHGSAAFRNEYIVDLQPLPMKTLKMRSLIVDVIDTFGFGATGDVVWSVYKVSPGATTATVTEVARTTIFFGVALPWTNGGTTFRIDAQNISPSTTWTDNDRVMVTCRNVGLASIGEGSSYGVGIRFTAVARFDVAED
jgi:hypothetical protein